jgi:hypothetical protein
MFLKMLKCLECMPQHGCMRDGEVYVLCKNEVSIRIVNIGLALYRQVVTCQSNHRFLYIYKSSRVDAHYVFVKLCLAYSV